MDNDNAVFELNKIKFKNNELPMPLFNKAHSFINTSMKQLKLVRDNNKLYEWLKRMVQSQMTGMKKIFIYVFWVFMAQKFPFIEMP